MAELLGYESDDVKLSYPKDWTKFDMGKGAVALLPPGKEITDLFAEKLTLMSTETSEFSKMPGLAGKTVTLDAIVNASIEMAGKQGFNIDKSEVAAMNLDSTPAKKIIISSTMEGTKLKIIQIIAIKGDKTFLISYSAPAETFAKYESAANEMIKSIKLK